MRLFIMQLPVASCNCLSHRPKYVLWCPILVHPQLMFFPKCEIQMPHPNKTTGKIMGLHSLPFTYVQIWFVSVIPKYLNYAISSVY